MGIGIISNNRKKQMKRKTHFLYVALFATAALLSACVDDHGKTTMNFNARIEQMDDGGAKTLLTGEQWIYWYEWDAISINSDCGGSNTPAEGILLNHGSNNYPEYNGVFQSTLEWGSKYFCALYPYSTNNVINAAGENSSVFSLVKVELPAEQSYTSDTSFAHNVMPMVAWYGGTPTDQPYTSPNLDFHSLGGIVRLQIYNTSGVDKTLDEITISSNGRDNRQLKGMFIVNDYNTFDPYLTKTSSAVEDRTITIPMPSGGISFTGTSLLSFYLVLPAVKGIDDSVIYHLTMTVKNTNGEQCSRNFTVPVRRNGITYMSALGIKDWSANTTEAGLSGNGTPERPFKVYTLEDLCYLRDCYNADTAVGTPRTINNQPITGKTNIRIMRSDIVLQNGADKKWAVAGKTGIKEFRGHMTYYATNASIQGISNISKLPLFESIADGGIVEGLTVRSNTSVTIEDAYNYMSPFCITNNGIIRDCHVATTGTTNENPNAFNYNNYSVTQGVAGICVTTNNIIENSGCSARINCSERRIAGICLENNGTIRGCFAASNMTANGASRASGICDRNTAGHTITDCYFAAHIANTSSNWGGIAFENAGSILHCYTSETATLSTTGTIGGIVHTLTDGLVNYCWSEASVNATSFGMVICDMTGGIVRNCFSNNTLIMPTLAASSGEHYGGGLVGKLDGSNAKIYNSFVNIYYVARLDQTGIVGGLVGIINSGTVTNCYAYQHSGMTRTFYGENNSGVSGTLTSCFLVDSPLDQAETTPITADASGFASLASQLNAFRTYNGNLQLLGYRWLQNDGIPPYLDSYENPPAKRK